MTNDVFKILVALLNNIQAMTCKAITADIKRLRPDMKGYSKFRKPGLQQVLVGILREQALVVAAPQEWRASDEWNEEGTQVINRDALLALDYETQEIPGLYCQESVDTEMGEGQDTGSPWCTWGGSDEVVAEGFAMKADEERSVGGYSDTDKDYVVGEPDQVHYQKCIRAGKKTMAVKKNKRIRRMYTILAWVQGSVKLPQWEVMKYFRQVRKMYRGSRAAAYKTGRTQVIYTYKKDVGKVRREEIVGQDWSGVYLTIAQGDQVLNAFVKAHPKMGAALQREWAPKQVNL